MGPDDIDVGDEPIEVQRRPRAGVVLSVRLAPDEADALQDIAERRGTTLSQVARDAITSYLKFTQAQPATSLLTYSSSSGNVGIFTTRGCSTFAWTTGKPVRTGPLRTTGNR